ncbi:MAG: hypothetical protein BM557_06410 [Flavobacterium sp. MedPE-SWcel]|uniref:hypothetical protein n=1 Tax=uncultured Flavobacterium sp. TaxID=165435 RepID=UPI000915D38D|nr:hypothetical protein [uncultured Flavobacterium sp.]OIQ19332.1 MAG: hypothetical protein BM557_06410 [Flavobacterium sp. MedPE-SWcel]
MKNIFITLLFLPLFINCQDKNSRDYPEVKKLSEYKKTDFVITPQSSLQEDKNAIYSASLLLAWQEIKVVQDKGIGVWGNPIGYTYLNRSESYKNTLLEDEYESFIAFDEEEGTMMAKAEFSKSLPFLAKFDSYPDGLTFKGEKVDAFGLNGSDDIATDNVRILYYKDDNNFIIKLYPKDTAHEIILCKGLKDITTLQQAFDAIAALTSEGDKARKEQKNWWRYRLEYEDELRIPKMTFNIAHEYPKLAGGKLIIDKQDYIVESVYQRTAFILDEVGAKVESEAVIEFAVEVMEEVEKEPVPKKLYFNEPFVVLLKRVDSKNPYLGLYVENNELFK